MNPQENPDAAAEIVSFWRAAGPDWWFERDDNFDRIIISKFLATHEAAACGRLAGWEVNAESALGLVILLDQFPRNMFRGSARAFATDLIARAVADRAIARAFDKVTEEALRQFFYLPFMHSELLVDQERSLQLYEALGDQKQLEYAKAHRDVILRFGRFPHRNQAMDRPSTPAELEFLKRSGIAG